MIKRFCDVCKSEMTIDDLDRIEGKVGNLQFQVNIGVNGGWNGGDVYHNCIFDAVHAEDHRPRMA